MITVLPEGLCQWHQRNAQTTAPSRAPWELRRTCIFLSLPRWACRMAVYHNKDHCLFMFISFTFCRHNRRITTYYVTTFHETRSNKKTKKKWKRSGEEEFLTSWNSSCRISLQSNLALKPSIDSRGGCDAPQLTDSVVSIHFVSLRHCSTSRWCYSHCAVGRIARQQVRKLTVNDIVLQILRNLCVHYVQPHSPPRQSERGHTLLVHPAYYARMIGNSACMN